MSLVNRALESILFCRPRALNILHSISLVNATSQTILPELQALERYAIGARKALEIGTYQGVSAARIAAALVPGGLLYCVDPWPETHGGNNPCWSICERHLRRSGVKQRIRIVRGYSGDVANEIPDNLDFAFVDGDHSWKGIETDWRIVSQKVAAGGFICLHDSVVPPREEWRQADSCHYFKDVIQCDPRFSLIEIIHSLAILQRSK